MMPAKRTRVPRICRRCGVEFLARPYELKIGKAIYCSRLCSHLWRGPSDQAARRCTGCGETKPVSDYNADRARSVYGRPKCKTCTQQSSAAYREANRESIVLARAAYMSRAKADALMAYGGAEPSCACCGESLPGMLSIDHANGDGAAHRRALKAGGTRNFLGTWFYVWLRNNDWPPGFRVLCLGCNQAIGIWKRCPHVDPSAGDVFMAMRMERGVIERRAREEARQAIAYDQTHPDQPD